jgi:hypothetical protein
MGNDILASVAHKYYSMADVTGREFFMQIEQIGFISRELTRISEALRARQATASDTGRISSTVCGAAGAIVGARTHWFPSALRGYIGHSDKLSRLSGEYPSGVVFRYVRPL